MTANGLSRRTGWSAALVGALLDLAVAPATAGAASALGGWGHFLQGLPRIHLRNPDGEAFSLRLHLFVKNMRQWRPEKVALRLTGPEGKVVASGKRAVEDGTVAVEVPAGPSGVYVLEPGMTKEGRAGSFRGPDFWLETSLDDAVVWAGPGKGHAIENRWLVTQCSVPRKWWFWVPPGVSRFRVKTQRANRYMSQREDPAITVYSPRGQRMAALVGQTPKRKHDMKGAEQGRGRTRSALIEVEPGAAGRFWALEMALGDSHHRSNINVTLTGVPPYLARSPESWFNPRTGSKPDVPRYDDSPFVQAAYKPKNPDRWPNLDHWSPCPAIGDPDGNIMLGEGTIALWNPAGRTLRFQLADYLPRVGFDRAAKEPRARVTVRNRAGKTLLERKMVVPHYHGDHAPFPEPMKALGEGVRFMTISGIERWWAFTYPAAPTVLVGEALEDGWHRFTPQVGNARNYYFRVPAGTRSFRVRARAKHETDRLRMEINAPDRTVELLYGRSETVRVDVPKGLDGRIWHLRPDVGSGTRMITKGGPDNRYLGIRARIDLKGVPPYLAPTWAHGVHPERPRPVRKRGAGGNDG